MSFLPITEILGCGFTSKEETGVIKSQNWPKNYKANTECMWTITVPLGKKITLTFTHFDLEPKDLLSSKCYDNVMLYDLSGLTNALNQKHGKFNDDYSSQLFPTTIITSILVTYPLGVNIYILDKRTSVFVFTMD